MSLGDSMKKIIGIEEEYDDEDITEEEVEEEKKRIAASKPAKKQESPAERPRPMVTGRQPERRFQNTNSGNLKLVLIEPKTFEECPKLVNSLKSRRPIIINLERIETDVARKIFDFLSGATYALNGNVQKVANNIFIFAPENVDIAGGQMQDKSGLEFPLDERKAEKKDDESPWR